MGLGVCVCGGDMYVYVCTHHSHTCLCARVCACIAGFVSWGVDLCAVLKSKCPGVLDVSPILRYYLTD